MGDFWALTTTTLCLDFVGGLALTARGEFVVWIGLLIGLFAAVPLCKYLRNPGDSDGGRNRVHSITVVKGATGATPPDGQYEA